MSNKHSDWAEYPMTIHQQNKWPFGYFIRDAKGEIVHEEFACSSSTGWKTIADMLEAKGIDDGTCSLTRQEWMAQIMSQRKKLMFLAQTEIIQETDYGC